MKSSVGPGVAAGRQKNKAPGTVFIGGHFPPSIRTALKQAEVNSGKRLKPLLGEAFTYICGKYRVHTLGPVKISRIKVGGDE